CVRRFPFSTTTTYTFKQSLYKPSGKIPSQAVLYMIIGAVLGVLAGGLSGLIVSHIGLLVTFLLVSATTWLADVTGRVFCCPAILAIVAFIVSYLASFVIAGIASALCVTGIGKKGKNRNVAAAAVLGMVSGALGAYVFSQGYMLIHTAMRSEGYALWGMIVGILISVISAWICSVHEVHEAKFCEECECFMSKEALRGLSWPGMRLITGALKSNNMEHAAIIIEKAGGKAGLPFLFTCPMCKKGYLEISAQFEKHWKTEKKGGGAKDEEKKETWLIASRELNAVQTDRFKHYVVKETK
ncbi:MAG TPA: hypothetical protein PLB62_15555, partial [Candidatus Sumerlaeota bacterium]|nr:hypothetical protein [Candidatus Sumerlaeota bacterium]